MSFAKQLQFLIDQELTGSQNIVKEDGIAYSAGYDNIIDSLFSDKLKLNTLLEKGIPHDMFKLVRTYSPFSDDEWADILEVSTKSLQRYQKDSRRFKRIHSEKVMQIAEISILGTNVFDSKEQFHQWLETPSYALGNHKPKELLNNAYGLDLVSTELINIDQGIFA